MTFKRDDSKSKCSVGWNHEQLRQVGDKLFCEICGSEFIKVDTVRGKVWKHYDWNKEYLEEKSRKGMDLLDDGQRSCLSH